MNIMKKIAKVLHHLLFGTVALLAFAFVEESVAVSGTELTVSGYFNMPPALVFLISMAVYLLASGKIITYNHRSALKGTNVVFWQHKYIITAACGFAVLLACCTVFYFIQDTVFVFASEQGTAISPEEAEARLAAMTNSIVLLLGPFFLWMLLLKNMVSGHDRNWPGTIRTFIRTDVSVYLVFRAAVFLLCIVGSLLIGFLSDDVQHSYFLFMMDDEQIQSVATGSLSSGGSFLSGITEAASFYVLITMAEELLSGTTRYTQKEQLRRMFLEKDTFKLLFMTLMSIAAGFLSFGGRVTLITTLVKAVLSLLWVISSLLFLADTAILPYIIIYTTMGFIERLLPLPEVTGFLVLVYPAIVMARILMFSVVAIMIANHQINQKKAMSLTAHAAGTGRPTLSHRLWSATFLDALQLILRVGEQGFFTARSNAPLSSDEQDLLFFVDLARLGNAYVDQLIDRITQALDSKERNH